LFWAIAFAMILLIPLSFPAWESSAFFSTSLVEIPPKVDFLSLYIPSNPFYSMANNIVPAVALFSILLGVFAISAAAAGTMAIEYLGRLQVYLISFNLAVLLLTFGILPLPLIPVTPFKYRDLIGMSKDALVTAFTTGNLFVVLTVLTDNCKKIFDKYDLKREKTDTYIDVLIPISFNFPNLGKLIMLLFVLFAVWFSGGSLNLGQYGTFVFSGLLSFFGGVDVALPFMLGSRLYFSVVVKNEYQKDVVVANMQLLQNPTTYRLYREISEKKIDPKLQKLTLFFNTLTGNRER
jgi:Na+/H+-dicarboxylate symporter